MEETELAQGMIIERYRLDRRIGAGGMGEVWAGTHTITRRPVALKFIKASVAVDKSMAERFVREARAAGSVRHPNVVQVHDVITHNALPVIVMDLLEGESLGELLAREKRLPITMVAMILCPVLSALRMAHESGIVHRDMKPDNIFLVSKADGRVEPEVLDFGIAKLSGETAGPAGTLTTTGAILGTPYYMPIEQLFAEKDIDKRADIWALGVILYECLSGARPIQGESLGQVFKAISTGAIVPLEQRVPDVPKEIAAVVGRMLSVDRGRRLSDLSEVYSALVGYAPVGSVVDERLSTGRQPGSARAVTSAYANTGDPSTVSAIRLPVAPRWPLFAIGGVAVLAAGVAFVVLRPSRSPPAIAKPAPSVSIAAVAPSAEPLAVVPEAGPEHDAAVAAPASTRPRSKPVVRVTATAAPVAPPPAPPATKPSDERLPGGVVAKPPF